MDEPLRSRLRPARRRGLTSPDPGHHALQPSGQPPASIPGQDLWTSRRTVSGKKATPTTTTIKITSVGSAQRNATTQIRAVD
jgi:hypothetical protein